jgi:hypothetical protein
MNRCTTPGRSPWERLAQPPWGAVSAGVVEKIGDHREPRSPEAIPLDVVGWPLNYPQGHFWADGKEDAF